MHVRAQLVSFLAAILLLIGQMMPAMAATLTLDTGKSASLDSGGTTGTFTISATNTGGSNITDFLGPQLSLQLADVRSHGLGIRVEPRSSRHVDGCRHIRTNISRRLR